MKILQNVLISISILYSFISYSSIYEECDWTNLKLTSKIIKQTNSTTSTCISFNPSGECADPPQQETPEDEGSFMLSFFKQVNTYLQEQEWFSFFYGTEEISQTTNTNKIENICFLASSIKGKNIFKVKGSEYSCSDGRTNLNQRFYYCDNVETPNSCQTVMSVTDDEGNTRLIYPRAPCLSEDYIQTLSTSFHNMSDCFNLSKRERNDLFSIIHHESYFMPNSRSPTGAKCAGQLTTRALINLNMNILLKTNPTYSIYANAIERCPYLKDIVIPTDLITNEAYQNQSYNELERKLEHLNFTCTLTSDMSRCFFYSFLFQQTSVEFLKQTNISVLDSMNPDDLKDFQSFVSYLAYNGGHSIIRRQLDNFINNMNPNENCLDNECPSQQLVNLDDLKTNFIEHLKKTKNEQGRHIYSEQTLNYPYAIRRDIDYFQSDSLIQHLLNFNNSPSLTIEEITNFSLEVKNNCQF